MLNWLIREKNCRIILLLEQKEFVMNLSKKADISYSYIARIICDLETQHIVEVNKAGRNAYVTLTDKGKILHKHLKSIMENAN